MTSQKQIDANRRNALKSTGPRTAAGKSAARVNAFKHGIFAENPTIVGENTIAFATLKQSLLDRFQPATPEEEILVATITRNAWLLERFSNVEVQVWDYRLNRINPKYEEDTINPLAVAHGSIYQSLTHLQRRIDSADRAYRRNLDYLLKLQAARQESAPEAVATGVPQPIAIPQPQSPEIVDIENGFVHSNPIPAPSVPSTPASPSPSWATAMPPDWTRGRQRNFDSSAVKIPRRLSTRVVLIDS